MSSRTSSRSTFTMVPSTMSPSLKYLMVSSIAARNSSSEPMSLMATWGVRTVSVLLVMGKGAPGTDMGSTHAAEPDSGTERFESRCGPLGLKPHGSAAQQPGYGPHASMVNRAGRDGAKPGQPSPGRAAARGGLVAT